MPPTRTLPILDALPVEAPRQTVLDAIPIDDSDEAVVDALPVLTAQPSPRKGTRFTRAIRFFGVVIGAIWSGLEWLFGAAVLLVGLAVLAALPVLQFLSLGYL